MSNVRSLSKESGMPGRMQGDRGERPAGPAHVVDQQHRAMGHRPGDRERLVGVAVLVEAVGQDGLGAGPQLDALDDRVHRHVEQPGDLLGEVTDWLR
jgi:hypothetical protein